MELFPAPFALGCSSLDPEEIIPVDVTGVPNDSTRRAISLQIKGINYKNTIENTSKDTNFATVLYNKKTKSISVIHSKAEFLVPVLSSETDQEPASLSNQVTKASEAFGSARLQKSLKEREKHALSVNVSKDLSNISKVMKSEARVEQSTKNVAERVGSDGLVDITSVLPEFDALTNQTSEIYPIPKLIPKKILTFLKTDSSTIFVTPGKDKETRQNFKTIMKRANKFDVNENSPTDEVKLEKAIVAYLRALMIMYRAHPAKFKQKRPFVNEDKNLFDNILPLFTTSVMQGAVKSRIMPPAMKQKLLNYIIITLLHIDRFSIKIDGDLCEDLLLTSDQIRKSCLFVGCKLKKTDDSTFIANLNSPLSLPSLTEQTGGKK